MKLPVQPTAAGARLFGSGDPRKQGMSVGGRKLADDLRIALPDLRNAAQALRLRAAAATTAFVTESKNVEKAIRIIEDEAAEMAAVANELLGNNPPDETPQS